mmetsp:Transcript_82143/g.164169  ORF Transcript_82143/g.164169 Transcript_82143/m.164169 type:complete len:185 (+) Transcript_82143:39-593(+)
MLLPRADKLLQDGENSPRQSSQTTGHSVGKRTRPRRVWLFGIISTAMVVLFLRGPSAKNIEVKKISDAPPGAFMLSSELEKTTPASTLSEIGTTNHFEHEVQNPNQETLPISPHRASHDFISMKSTEKARPTPITSAAAAAAATFLLRFFRLATVGFGGAGCWVGGQSRSRSGSDVDTCSCSSF